MTGAEFRIAREFLGLSTKWMAEYLSVNERELFRWEKSESPVPDGVAGEMDDLLEASNTIVRRLVQEYRRLVKENDGDGVELLTFRKDEEYWLNIARDQSGVGDKRFPARWHRMLCARVAAAVPGLIVDYWEPAGQAA